ncbi:MAG: GCN5-related N-acetyltransferase [Firmicutes bacterium]|nr:GCN5-related N-acetyltransferase [Bacillota bacterium]
MQREKAAFETIDDYIKQFPPEVKEKLEKLRTVIKDAAPDSVERISYQMPTFYLQGNLVHFAAFERHIGFYPAPSGIEEFKNELAGYKSSKGAVQFPIDKPLPYELISRIVRFRAGENIAAAAGKKKKKITIRRETEKDFEAVHRVVKAAFEKAGHSNGDEQELVGRLRKSDSFIPELSLVAEHDGRIVGHILFTKAMIGGSVSLAMAPLSVLPEYQNQGIGGKLILEGHRIAKKLGYRSVILVGHADYYPRFGYSPAGRWGIKASFDVPDENFMAAELVKGGLDYVSGIVEHAAEFFIESTS